MKRLLLSFALTFTAFASVLAEGITKSQNAAAITAGHTQLAAKITVLEQSVNSNNLQTAQTVAQEVQTLMIQGMKNVMDKINLEQNKDKQKSIHNAEYLALEKASFEYRQLATNVSANGKEIVKQAKAFLSKY
jgi:hypothetical protein